MEAWFTLKAKTSGTVTAVASGQCLSCSHHVAANFGANPPSITSGLDSRLKGSRDAQRSSVTLRHSLRDMLHVPNIVSRSQSAPS